MIYCNIIKKMLCENLYKCHLMYASILFSLVLVLVLWLRSECVLYITFPRGDIADEEDTLRIWPLNHSKTSLVRTVPVCISVLLLQVSLMTFPISHPHCCLHSLTLPLSRGGIIGR